MISIIIPVYNQADKILETLKSIALQSYRDYEVIIVNDGSSDGVEMVFANYIKESDDKNNYYFINQENKGAPAARNKGLEKAQGDYVFFCDADTSLASKALAELLSALEKNPQAAYAYSSFYWGKKFFKVGKIDELKLKAGPCIHTSSLIRKSDLPKGAWDESIKKFQDWDLYLSILKEKSKLGVFVEQVLFKVSPGGTMSSWLPSFAYKFLFFLPRVRKYNKALKIIKDKHELYF